MALRAKTCSSCGVVKLVDQFAPSKRQCKACRAEYYKSYVAANKEKVSNRNKKWRESKLEHIKQQSAAYYLENKERINSCSTKYYQDNKDKVKKVHAKYYLDNKESIDAANAKYRLANRDKEKARSAKHFRANPGRYRAYVITRRCRKLQVEGVHTHQDIENIYTAQQGRCVYCNDILTKYHVDHIIPVTRKGSTNWPSNLQLLCAFCNLSKGAKTHEEYVAYRNNRGMVTYAEAA